MNAQETQKFLAKALQYAILIQKLYEKLNKLSLENRKCDIEWKKNIEYVNLVEEQETKLYHSILPTSLIWIISSKKQLAEMFMGKKEKNLVSFYIEGDTCQRQAERRVTSKLNKLPYEGILFGVEISDPSNYIFNDLFKKFWIRIKEKIQDPLIQTMVFRLAYLDEAFESLCIRNDFSIKNTYLPILNKEQEERKKINKRSVYNLKKSSRFSFLCVP